MIFPFLAPSVPSYIVSPSPSPSPSPSSLPPFVPSRIAQSPSPSPSPPPLIPTAPTNPSNVNKPILKPSCDELLGGIFCNNGESTQTEVNIDINKIDGERTRSVCAYSGACNSSIPTISLNSIQEDLQRASKITDSQSWVIYPIIYDDRIELITIPPSGKEIHKVIPNVKQVELTETVQNFLDSIRDPSSNDYLESSQRLYNWIIRPLDSDLKDAEVKTLIFVMDGILRAIPIGALHDGKQFLVQKYAIAAVPSMGLANLKIPDRRNSKILAMG